MYLTFFANTFNKRSGLGVNLDWDKEFQDILKSSKVLFFLIEQIKIKAKRL